jgi:hypothetical protein
MTETRAQGPAEVMERQRWNLTDLCFLFFNHAPDDLGTEAATPDSASFVNGPKQNATRDSGIHALIPALTQSWYGLFRLPHFELWNNF